MNNRIKSLVFLFAILFSFTAGAYNSFTRLSKSNNSLFKQVCVDPAGENTLQGDAVFFEELEDENDNEDSPGNLFFILPHVAQPSLFSCLPTSVVSVKSQAISINPIFITIRVLRI